MSKSTGNFFRLIDLINQGFNPLSLRYFILNTYYRKTANFSIEALSSSQNALNNLYFFIDKIKLIKKLTVLRRFALKNTDFGKEILENHLQDFYSALNDDLNTPKALEII